MGKKQINLMTDAQRRHKENNPGGKFNSGMTPAQMNAALFSSTKTSNKLKNVGGINPLISGGMTQDTFGSSDVFDEDGGRYRSWAVGERAEAPFNPEKGGKIGKVEALHIHEMEWIDCTIVKANFLSGDWPCVKVEFDKYPGQTFFRHLDAVRSFDAPPKVKKDKEDLMIINQMAEFKMKQKKKKEFELEKERIEKSNAAARAIREEEQKVIDAQREVEEEERAKMREEKRAKKLVELEKEIKEVILPMYKDIDLMDCPEVSSDSGSDDGEIPQMPQGRAAKYGSRGEMPKMNPNKQTFLPRELRGQEVHQI